MVSFVLNFCLREQLLCWNSCLRYVKKGIILRAYFKVAVLSGWVCCSVLCIHGSGKVFLITG